MIMQVCPNFKKSSDKKSDSDLLTAFFSNLPIRTNHLNDDSKTSGECIKLFLQNINNIYKFNKRSRWYFK